MYFLFNRTTLQVFVTYLIGALYVQISRNWRYESEPPLKPSRLTCYRQFGTNSIMVLMFVESQRVHILRIICSVWSGECWPQFLAANNPL